MHHDPAAGTALSLSYYVFIAANLAIAIGYVVMPVLVFRLLPLTRDVLIFAAIFLIGCGGTHFGMALLVRRDPGWVWTLEHVLQAIGTWGFILTFHRMLRRAHARRRAPTGGGGTS